MLFSPSFDDRDALQARNMKDISQLVVFLRQALMIQHHGKNDEALKDFLTSLNSAMMMTSRGSRVPLLPEALLAELQCTTGTEAGLTKALKEALGSSK